MNYFVVRRRKPVLCSYSIYSLSSAMIKTNSCKRVDEHFLIQELTCSAFFDRLSRVQIKNIVGGTHSCNLRPAIDPKAAKHTLQCYSKGPYIPINNLFSASVCVCVSLCI